MVKAGTVGRELLEFGILRGDGGRKRELDFGGDLGVGTRQTEGGTASTKTMVSMILIQIPRCLLRGVSFNFQNCLHWSFGKLPMKRSLS